MGNNSQLYAYEDIEAGAATLTVTAASNQFREIDLSAKLFDVTSYEKPVQKEVHWTEWECDYVPGDGKGDWHGFYNLPKNQKPQALADAIKGIGLKTAETIVLSGRNYFSPKPRTWNEFKNEISQIEREQDLKGLYANVISKFGDENMTNLGYRGESANCRVVDKHETIWTTETITERHFIRTLPRIVDISVNGSRLLQGEQEVITARYDGRNVTFDLSRTYNQYTAAEEARGVFVLRATGRQPVRPNLADFNIGLTKEGGSLFLNVQDNRFEELNRLSSGYRLNVAFTFKKKQSGCKKDLVVAKSTVTLQGAMGRIDLTDAAQKAGQSVEAGATYYVTGITVERLGTDFFSGTSGETKTSEVMN